METIFEIGFNWSEPILKFGVNCREAISREKVNCTAVCKPAFGCAAVAAGAPGWPPFAGAGRGSLMAVMGVGSGMITGVVSGGVVGLVAVTLEVIAGVSTED